MSIRILVLGGSGGPTGTGMLSFQQCCPRIAGVGPGSNDETLLSAVASALHTSSAPITGQISAAVEKNPAVWLNTSQPLCKAFIVTDEDIR